MPDREADTEGLRHDEPQDRGRRGAALGLWAGLVGFALVVMLWRQEVAPGSGSTGGLAAVGAVALLMAIWWMTEAVPIPVTSLAPMVLLPVFAGEPFDLARVAANYANWQVFLFFGGFLVAVAMEVSGLHRRIALTTVRAIGRGPGASCSGSWWPPRFFPCGSATPRRR